MSIRMKKAIALLVLCLLMGAMAWYVMNWSGWVQGWVGTHFKLITGALMGWAFDRYFLCNDLDELPAEARPLAALQRALVCGLFALGAATGV